MPIAGVDIWVPTVVHWFSRERKAWRTPLEIVRRNIRENSEDFEKAIKRECNVLCEAFTFGRGQRKKVGWGAGKRRRQ